MNVTPAVWAPYVDSVALDTGDEVRRMRRDTDGWWHGQRALPHGQDYFFHVNGEGPYPDPRSNWQPAGVHGPSRIVDHSLFQWHDAGWRARDWEDAVIYELHVGTFTPQGTFAGVAEKLDYLVELGATHIELMPVAAFPGKRGWGYDGVAPYAPYEVYGGPEGLKRLVDACHLRDMGVLLDVVYNHLGPDGNVLGIFGPYFTDRYHTPWGDALNFDGRDSDEVRRFFIDNAKMWVRDYHVDGLRIDAVHAIVDTAARHFLEQLHDELHAMRTAAGQLPVIVIESDRNDPRPIRETARGGYGLDGLWNEDFHHALHAALTGERQGYYEDFSDVEDIAAALRRGFVYEGRYSTYRRCSHGRCAEVPPGRLIGFLQNHDQVGNRATGDRIGALVGTRRQHIGAALVLLSPFIPLIFQGEEWAASTPFPYFTDFGDQALAEAVRNGRRREFAAFGWKPEDVPDPQAEETFAAARLRWNEQHEPEHADMLDWYGRLLAVRRDMIARGVLHDWPRVEANREQQWLLVDYGELLVICNLDDAGHDIAVPAARNLYLREAFGPITEGPDNIHLAPGSVAVMEAELRA